MSEKLYIKRGDKYVEVGIIDLIAAAPDSAVVKAPIAQPAQQAADPQPQTGEIAIEVIEFGLAKRPDGKFQLELFTKLTNDKVGKYPTIRYVAEREGMWTMAGALLEPYVKQPSDLPIRAQCLWHAYYTLGRETGKTDSEGKPTRYKDLTRLELMF